MKNHIIHIISKHFPSHASIFWDEEKNRKCDCHIYPITEEYLLQTRAPLLIITWFHWNNLKSKKSVSMYKESNISSLKKFCHHSPKIWHFFHIKKIKNPNISNVSLRSYYKFRKYTHTRRHVVASPLLLNFTLDDIFLLQLFFSWYILNVHL